MEDVTLEELATAVQNGNNEIIPLLWERTERLIKMLILHHIRKRMLPSSIDIEDLLQCGYFALLSAVKYYKRDNIYKFTTYLNYCIQKAINNELGYKKQIKEYSYNKTVSNTDGEETELINLIKDHSAEYNVFETAELTDTQRIIIEAVNELSPQHKEVVKMHWFNNMTFKEIAELKHCSIENISRIEREAFGKLRANNQLKKLYNYCTSFECLYYSPFKYSPEYFEAIRQAERLEKECTKYMTYGKRQAQLFLLLYKAEQEFNKKYH